MSFIKAQTEMRIIEWHVGVGDQLQHGTVVLTYRPIKESSNNKKELKFRSNAIGKIKKIYSDLPGQAAVPGSVLIELESCGHTTVMKDMCADCGVDLRNLEKPEKCFARVSMVPNVPELKISAQKAEELGKEDKDRLHNNKKLVLLVDLDQTVIHTTQSPKYAVNNKEVYQFQLQRSDPLLYTKLRPGCRQFLADMSRMYELQIVTFGSRQYAHKIAAFIDPDEKLFAQRILSRDECFNPQRKSSNLKHLFPCGDSMVCIIDDRDDVWNCSANLIQVKKYSYFPDSGDINSPDKFRKHKQPSSQHAKGKEQREDQQQQPEVIAETNRKRKRSTDDDCGDDDDEKQSKCARTCGKTQEGVDTVEDECKTSSEEKSATSASSDEDAPASDEKQEKQDGMEKKEGSNGDAADTTTRQQEKDSQKDSVLPDHDNYLERLKVMLTEIHSTYYKAYEEFKNDKHQIPPDIRGIVPFIKSKVLYDCVLVMTGIIPHNYTAPHATHKAYIIAKQLGATVEEHVDEKTTHLICGKKGTAKYQDAMKQENKKIHFVTQQWLWSCSERWERMAESKFSLKNIKHAAPEESKSKEEQSRIREEVGEHTAKHPVGGGKLISKVKDARLAFRMQEAIDRVHNTSPNPLFCSLKVEDAVISMSSEMPRQSEATTTTTASSLRERKPSMAESTSVPVGTGYMTLSLFADMAKEVDEEMTSDDDEELGTNIENIENSQDVDENNCDIEESQRGEIEDSSSNSSDEDDEEYGEMADLIGRDLEYENDSADED